MAEKDLIMINGDEPEDQPEQEETEEERAEREAREAAQSQVHQIAIQWDNRYWHRGRRR